MMLCRKTFFSPYISYVPAYDFPLFVWISSVEWKDEEKKVLLEKLETGSCVSASMLEDLLLKVPEDINKLAYIILLFFGKPNQIASKLQEEPTSAYPSTI